MHDWLQRADQTPVARKTNRALKRARLTNLIRHGAQFRGCDIDIWLQSKDADLFMTRLTSEYERLSIPYENEIRLYSAAVLTQFLIEHRDGKTLDSIMAPTNAVSLDADIYGRDVTKIIHFIYTNASNNSLTDAEWTTEAVAMLKLIGQSNSFLESLEKHKFGLGARFSSSPKDRRASEGGDLNKDVTDFFKKLQSDSGSAKTKETSLQNGKAHSFIEIGTDFTTSPWLLEADRKSTRLNSSHSTLSRMPSSA